MTVYVYLAKYSASSCTAEISGFHHANVLVKYWFDTPFVGVSPLYSGISPCQTFSSVSNTVPSIFFHVTSYLLVVCEYVAVYVVHVITLVTEGLHQLNTYAYIQLGALCGVDPLYTGVSPYSTIHVCNTVQSSFWNVIKYLFTILLNSAVIVQSHVNICPHVLFHPLNT